MIYITINLLPVCELCKLQLVTLVNRVLYHNHELPNLFECYFTYNNLVHEHFTKQSDKMHINGVNQWSIIT